ncbi:MAG TPA: Holliday junction resolvase RecU [Bacilli bacterium]|nr:Holliday junction resolvase RecU [Bacilli bacterium]
MRYPSGLNKEFIKEKRFDNRGMNLEDDLNITNDYYLYNNIACIYKKPTPIKIVKVDYPNRSNSKITEAYFKIPSTTDYNGIYKGKYIDFEAKETQSLNFPLENIHDHQIKHLNTVYSMGGIAFIIVYFSKTSDIYLLEIKEFNNFINTNHRKSIPITYFKDKGYKLEYKYNPRIDYLKIIDTIINMEVSNEKENKKD